MELTVTKAVMATTPRIALLGIADDAPGQQIAREVGRIARMEAMMPVVCTRNAGQIHELCTRFQPAAILLETVQRLAVLAPVVLVAPVDQGCAHKQGLVERQGDMAALVVSGDIDFVARTGDFAPLAVGLMERKLKALRPPSGDSARDALHGDLGEMFRHEINNPLTGIFGNAEMLLSHRERLPLADAQRLQTVVDLAVRLHETIPRISNAWERQREGVRAACSAVGARASDGQSR